MQTIATSELVRIFMQIKLQNYQKKKMEKKNEQTGPNLAAPGDLQRKPIDGE